jgi:hypothetical protein
MVHMPAFGLPLVRVALLVKLAAPLTTADVSPLTKPVIVVVGVGVAGYVIVWLFAVTVKGALDTVIVVVPLLLAMPPDPL